MHGVGPCATDVATLKDKHIHPHSLRHTTAIHLLKAGVDFGTAEIALLRHNAGFARQAIQAIDQQLSHFPDYP